MPLQYRSDTAVLCTAAFVPMLLLSVFLTSPQCALALRTTNSMFFHPHLEARVSSLGSFSSSFRNLRQTSTTTRPSDITAAMARFRSVEAKLLARVEANDHLARREALQVYEGLLGCDGITPESDSSMIHSSAQALRSTSGQYPELEPFADLRDSLIQAALKSVGTHSLTQAECRQHQMVAEQLGVPDEVQMMFGRR